MYVDVSRYIMYAFISFTAKLAKAKINSEKNKKVLFLNRKNIKKYTKKKKSL